MTRRARILPAGAAGILAAALACSGGRSGTGTEVQGTIARARGDEVAIRVPEGNEVTLRVGPGTRVKIGGRDASAKDLPEGAAVRASYAPGGGGAPVATSIEANEGAGRATMRGGGSEMQGANRGPAGGAGAARGEAGKADAAPAPAPGASPTVNGAHGGEGGNPSGSSGPAHSGPERQAK